MNLSTTIKLHCGGPGSGRHKVTFEWKEQSNGELHGYTKTHDGIETRIFQIFKREGKKQPFRLARGKDGEGGVEDFKKKEHAKEYAESLLNKEAVEIKASIADDAVRVLHKKIGKTKGMSAIEDQIRNEATTEARKALGSDIDRVAKVHIDRYVQKRMQYMKNAFKKLNNPKTDTSQTRADFIGDTENRSAKEFGKHEGYKRLAKQKNKTIYKQWNTTSSDTCPDCEANEAAGPIEIDDTFPSGDDCPQAHPGCTCYLTYTDDDGNEDGA